MKKLVITTSVLITLALAGYFGVGQYRSWRQSRLIQRAKACMTQADFRNASLCARQAVESDPKSIEASRILAELAEMGHKTNALFWRQRVVELEPGNATNHLLLARAAMMQSAPSVAQRALNQVDAKTRSTADFHKLQANLHWNAGQFPLAETHFTEAVRLEPTNLISKMNLNLVRLPSTNLALAIAARHELQAMATNEALRAEILRQLITDAVYRNKPQEAARISQDLMRSSDTMNDQLRHAGLLRETRSQDFEPYLTSLQSRYRTNSAQAAAIARWMLSRDLTSASIAWLRSLPGSIQEQRQVSVALAEGLLAAADWSGLSKHLEPGSWGEHEHFRELLLSRVAREQSNQTGSRSHWLKSLKAASGNIDRLAQLARMAESWKWRDEMDDALGAIVERFPEQKWAEEYLSVSLHLGGKTQALQNLFGKTVEREPTNHLAKSNFATLGMLLNPGDKHLHRLAEEAFQAQGTNAFVASTYALSLHFRKQTAEALLVMERLPAERLESPSIAAWYGYLLSEAGHKQRARRYLQLAEKAKLLPEEKRLLAKAGLDG